MTGCSVCEAISKYYSKGMCSKCYMHIHNQKATTKLSKKLYFAQKINKTNYWRIKCRKGMRVWRAKNYFGLTIDEYNKLVTKCAICGFDITVQLHHKDKNRKNNDVLNLVPLCPNHHRMAHMNLIKFEDEK